MKVLVLALLLLCILPEMHSKITEWGYDDAKWTKPKKGDKLVADGIKKGKAYNILHHDLDEVDTPVTSCGVEWQKTDGVIYYQVCLNNRKRDKEVISKFFAKYVMIRKTVKGVSYWKYVHQELYAEAQ
jgi:hypothetical protein